MVYWNKNRAKNRAQVTRRACALAVSASLGMGSVLPALAQDTGPVNPTANPVTPGANGPGAAVPGNDPTRTIPSNGPATGTVSPNQPNPGPATPGPATPPLNLPGLPAPGPTTPEAGGAPDLTGRVSRVTIRGNVNISDAAIRTVITQSGLTLGGSYSAGAADTARDAIKKHGLLQRRCRGGRRQ